MLNDKITIDIPEPKKASLKPFKYKLNIVHEDKDLLVINKQQVFLCIQDLETMIIH